MSAYLRFPRRVRSLGFPHSVTHRNVSRKSKKITHNLMQLATKRTHTLVNGTWKICYTHEMDGVWILMSDEYTAGPSLEQWIRGANPHQFWARQDSMRCSIEISLLPLLLPLFFLSYLFYYLHFILYDFSIFLLFSFSLLISSYLLPFSCLSFYSFLRAKDVPWGKPSASQFNLWAPHPPKRNPTALVRMICNIGFSGLLWFTYLMFL